jgi:hypothetical protein
MILFGKIRTSVSWKVIGKLCITNFKLKATYGFLLKIDLFNPLIIQPEGSFLLRETKMYSKYLQNQFIMF